MGVPSRAAPGNGAPAVPSDSHSAPPARRSPKGGPLSLPRFSTAAGEKTEAAPTPETRQQRAAYLVDDLFGRLAPYRDLDPEDAANQLQGFMAGVTSAIRQLDGSFSNELSQEIGRQLCASPQPGDARLITLAYLTSWMPAAASAEGFDCFFSHPHPESTPLWYMMDAWQTSGLEKPPGLLALGKAAKDDRTLRRLLPASERLTARLGAAASNSPGNSP
jgi:hypothetical protein